jgi:hypothetical protein
VSSRSGCGEIHPNDAVSLCGRFLARPRETIESPDGADIVESRRGKHLDELCLQQSAGDSTSPEIDVTERALGQHFPDDDVGDLRVSAGLQDTGDLRDCFVFVGYEIQHAI